MLVFAVGLGYFSWPNIYNGCKKYNCSWTIDNQHSYCYNDTCHYYYFVVIDNNTSWWPWHIKDSSNSDSWWESNVSTIQPYPNNTICYKPPYCNTYLNIWIHGYNCQPIFSCINKSRINARFIYIIISLGFIGSLYLILLGYFCRWHFNLPL